MSWQVVAVIAVFVLGIVWFATSSVKLFDRRTSHPAMRQRVIVNNHERAFMGVLWQRDGDFIVLRDVALHERGTTTAVDGDVVIDLSHVDFMQLPQGGGNT